MLIFFLFIYLFSIEGCEKFVLFVVVPMQFPVFPVMAAKNPGVGMDF